MLWYGEYIEGLVGECLRRVQRQGSLYTIVHSVIPTVSLRLRLGR